MALSAAVLDRLHTVLGKAGVHVASANGPKSSALPLGIDVLDAALPDGGLLRGGVVELSVAEPGALATTVALAACRSLQGEARARGANVPWCAFVDPSATLYAPGVAEAGVELERLLVVRPTLEALSRTALRLTESPAFSLVVVDLIGMPGAAVSVSLGMWPRIVRRLAMAVDGTERSVLLLTDAAERRPLPLPVAQRIELSRPKPQELVLRVAKDRRGRITPPRPIVWTRSRTVAPVPSAPSQQIGQHGRRSA